MARRQARRGSPPHEARGGHRGHDVLQGQQGQRQDHGNGKMTAWSSAGSASNGDCMLSARNGQTASGCGVASCRGGQRAGDLLRDAAAELLELARHDAKQSRDFRAGMENRLLCACCRRLDDKYSEGLSLMAVSSKDIART